MRREKHLIFTVAAAAVLMGCTGLQTVAAASDATQKTVQRLSDIQDIQNLMSRYEYYHTANLHQASLDLFSKRVDIKLEIANLGIWDGPQGVRRFFIVANAEGKDKTGVLIVHTLTTPIIEIAADGKTAQGMWVSPGNETLPRPDGVSAQWSWNRYFIDFIKEDGQWKFWHFHLSRIFKNPYDKSWAEVGPTPTPKLPADAAPNRPTEDNWVYSPTATVPLFPEPPRPYQTWSDAMSYVK